MAFLLQGQSKAEIFAEIRSGRSDVPAAQVHPVGDITWFADRAAAGGLRQKSKKFFTNLQAASRPVRRYSQRRTVRRTFAKSRHSGGPAHLAMAS